MALPSSLTLRSGDTVSPRDLVPPHLRGEALDLEGLMIIAQLTQNLPADALYSAIGHGRLETELARPVLTAMISLFIPKMAGARMLSAEMIDGVAITLAERDHGVGGGFIDGLYLRLREVLLDRCRGLRTADVAPLWGPLLESLHELLRRGRAAGTLPVFTTNYDATFEHLAAARRLRSLPYEVFLPTRPFPGQPGWLCYDPAAYARYRASGPGLELVVFHLHGSIAWQRAASAAGASVMAVADDPRAHALIDAADFRARGMLFPDGLKVSYQKDLRPLVELFAPASKEHHDFDPDGALYPMALNYRYFEKCLEHARTLVAIGYSFRDSDGRDLLLAARQRWGAPDLVLVDPDPGPVVERLGGPAPWIHEVPHGFGSAAALDGIMDSVAVTR